jgi:hypothetical protein
MGSEHWFIDETKASGLTFAVVAVSSQQVGRCRVDVARLSSIARRRSSGLHFYAEKDSTRSAAYGLIAHMPITVTLITVPSGVKAVEARRRAIQATARRAKETKPQRIVFELDEAAVANDNRWLRAELGAFSGIEYQHVQRSGDPMLWVADGFAWAVQRGGKWLDSIRHLITETVRA